MRTKCRYVISLFCFLLLISCNSELPESSKFDAPYVKIPVEDLAVIEELGFKTDGIVVTEDAYWVEGDIVIPKKYVDEIKSEPETRQSYYGIYRIVSDSKVRNIKIATAYYNSTPANDIDRALAICAGQLDGAIAALNNLPNCAVKITRVTYSQNPDILIETGGGFNWNSPVHQEIMCAGEIPSGNGYPGRSVYVNAEPYATGLTASWKWSNISAAKVKTSLIHAIGHCLGLAHTGATSPEYPTGGLSELTERPELIPGSSHQDSQSIMRYSEHTYNNTIRTLSDGDKQALRLLYPLVPAPTLNLIIDGPTTGTVNQELTFEIKNGSTGLSATDFSFAWTATGGTVIPTGATTNNRQKVTYATGGNKSVSVSVVHRATGKTYNTVTRTVNVKDDIVTSIENDIQITGNFKTGSEHSISYVPYNSQSSTGVFITASMNDSYKIVSSFPMKVIFFKPGTFTITMREGRFGETLLAERVINIEGNNIVRFYAYKQDANPFDYLLTTTNHGLYYSINGPRTMVGASVNGRSGSMSEGVDPTHFFAISPDLNTNDGPALIPIYESYRRPVNGPLYSYTYSTNSPSSSLKFYVYSKQQAGTVPLYLFNTLIIKRNNGQTQSDFYYLSTAKVTQRTEIVTKDGLFWESTSPGVIVGYVYPISYSPPPRS